MDKLVTAQIAAQGINSARPLEPTSADMEYLRMLVSMQRNEIDALKARVAVLEGVHPLRANSYNPPAQAL